MLGKIKGGNKILLKSFSKEIIIDEIRIKDIEILGSENTVNWEYNPEGLYIELPEDNYDELASVLKIKTDG